MCVIWWQGPGEVDRPGNFTRSDACFYGRYGRVSGCPGARALITIEGPLGVRRSTYALPLLAWAAFNVAFRYPME